MVAVALPAQLTGMISSRYSIAEVIRSISITTSFNSLRRLAHFISRSLFPRPVASSSSLGNIFCSNWERAAQTGRRCPRRILCFPRHLQRRYCLDPRGKSPSPDLELGCSEGLVHYLTRTSPPLS